MPDHLFGLARAIWPDGSVIGLSIADRPGRRTPDNPATLGGSESHCNNGIPDYGWNIQTIHQTVDLLHLRSVWLLSPRLLVCLSLWNPHLRLALRICSPWALLSLSGLFGIYCMDGSRMSLVLGTENEMSEFGDERWGANLEHAYRLQGSTMSCASRVPGSSPLTRLQQPDKELKEGCIYFTCLTLLSAQS